LQREKSEKRSEMLRRRCKQILKSVFLSFPVAQRSFSSSNSISRIMNLVGLDFDGVICASAEESSTSALLAAEKLWPDVFAPVLDDARKFNRVRDILLKVRPVIEVGYDCLLLTRFIYENSIERNSFNDETITEHILDHFSAKFREDLIKQFHSDKNTLMHAFGSTRDALIQADRNRWVSLNPVFPEISSYFKSSQTVLRKDLLFIITTKQERFVRAILSANGMDWIVRDGITNKRDAESEDNEPTDPSKYSNMFDFDNRFGSKLNVLLELSRRYSAQSLHEHSQPPIIHFVEDRFDTLMKIKKHIREKVEQLSLLSHPSEEILKEISVLKNLRLYLVDWGYNTAKQRQQLVKMNDEHLQLINFSDFRNLMSKIHSS
jgi:hypothetical protein